jgi:hypothetical protein
VPRADPGLGVLDHEAASRRDPEQPRGPQVALGVRLADSDVLDRDEHRRPDRGRVQAQLRQADIGAGDHGPRDPQLRQNRQQTVCSGRSGDVAQILILELELPGGRRPGPGRVQVRADAAHGALGGTAVRDGHDAGRVNGELFGPPVPGSLDGGIRIHQRAIHVEQHRVDRGQVHILHG